MRTITIQMDNDAYCALKAAIAAGAFAHRHEQLTELLRLNRGHVSIANGIEGEIEALQRAALLISAGRG